ncbi:GIY-YIG nuclease family protein [Fictibacillus sp. Mic-4]|uniref:GIY-YIG nuclease family protein n=1 Tax=Fictibacillus sp. Mic-4 TaxID=3132826 RepID=UPI003CF4678B
MAIEITLPSDTVTFKVGELSDYDDLLQLKPGGVYALYGDDNECLYVGQSKVLSKRLRSHLTCQGNSAVFCDLIRSITIYFVRDSVERDIYETYAITHLNAKFNRAKIRSVKRTFSRNKLELIEDLRYDLDLLRTIRADILTEIDAVNIQFATPKYRKINSFTGELTNRFLVVLT